MTIDPSARRYWYAGKHTKAIHATGVFFGENKKTILVSYLHMYNCFMTVTVHKNANENKALQINTWDYRLKKSMEVHICLVVMRYIYQVVLFDQPTSYVLYIDFFWSA